MHPTPCSEQADAHRNAYNAAFHELGLRFHWDSARYGGVLCGDGERDCLRNYLRNYLRSYLEQHQAHVLTAYEVDFLVDAIQAAKQHCFGVMSAAYWPGAFINRAEIQQQQACP